jgi:hypothetical protein
MLFQFCQKDFPEKKGTQRKAKKYELDMGCEEAPKIQEGGTIFCCFDCELENEKIEGNREAWMREHTPGLFTDSRTRLWLVSL